MAANVYNDTGVAVEIVFYGFFKLLQLVCIFVIFPAILVVMCLMKLWVEIKITIDKHFDDLFDYDEGGL